MKGLWWKLLAVMLMLYVVLAGMLIPLKPGVQSLEPRVVQAGEKVTLKVVGYNTHFEDNGQLRAWLRLGEPRKPSGPDLDTATAASEVRILGPQVVELVFDLPSQLPGAQESKRASLLIDNPTDGPFVLPKGITITPAVNPQANSATWSDPITNLSTFSGLTYPYRGLLGETIRNQFFHVSLWFALMTLMLIAAVYALLYLLTGREEFDLKSQAFTRIGTVFGLLGITTGMMWATYTWGKPWSGDIKQEMTAVALLIYLAYFVLRGSLNSEQMAARVGAGYNLFAFAMLVPLLYVIPRMRDSLHPGAGGNPGFGGDDLDNTMRMVFYPGIIGFILVGVWLASLWYRYRVLAKRREAQLLHGSSFDI